jgi:quinol monooxygenase YgiN
MAGEDPPQMPRRDRQPRPERCLGAGVQHAVDDQLDGTAEEFRRPGRDRVRHPVRAAAQASTEPRCFRARDPARPDYLLFVEHFADQAAYDAHTGSAVYKELIAGRFAGLITEFVEIDHELLVGI